MLSDENLLLAVQGLAKQGQKPAVLLLLSHVEQPAPTMAIRNKGVQIGYRQVTQWNLSAILKSAANDGYVAQLKEGWKLLAPGLKSLDTHYSPDAPIVSETRHSLKDHVSKVANAERRAFIEEAIKCFDAKAYRAAIVLSWVGAVYILQEHIIAKQRSSFNAAGVARAAKTAASGTPFVFSPVKSLKDFGVIAEGDLLQVCQDAGMLHKAEKKMLQDRLDLRNQCGHPNPLEFAEHSVAFHIEQLMLNVYSKY
jgi:hypothetical protein